MRDAQYENKNHSRESRTKENIRTPLISVVMSVYNSEATVGDAIDSILNQTYENWELIICDDGSSDSTLTIIKEKLNKLDSSKYKLLINKENKKLAYSLNRCLEVTTGEFIARMDADDYSEPNRFEKQLNYLQDRPEVDLVGSAYRRFNANGVGEIRLPISTKPDKSVLATTTRVPFAHPTIFARREVFSEIGNYTDAWYTARSEDLDLWYKFFAANKVGHNIEEPLYRFREDEGAVRRRTPKARFGAVVTRIKGNRLLRFSWRAYVPVILELVKILIPYKVFDFYRQYIQK